MFNPSNHIFMLVTFGIFFYYFASLAQKSLRNKEKIGSFIFIVAYTIFAHAFLNNLGLSLALGTLLMLANDSIKQK